MFQRFVKEEEGQTLVEYSLLAAFAVLTVAGLLMIRWLPWS